MITIIGINQLRSPPGAMHGAILVPLGHMERVDGKQSQGSVRKKEEGNGCW